MARRLRLWSGLVLFFFVTTHLLNHTLGIVSLNAAETGRLIFLAAWRNPFGTLLLYSALLTHVVLEWSDRSGLDSLMLPITCLQRSARPCRRFRFRPFPATFESPGRGDLVEALRFREVV